MRKLLGMGFMTAALALAAACGGEGEPAAPGGASGSAGAGGEQPRVEAVAPAGTQAPLPTRPQRIEDRLLTPTAAPKPAEEPEAGNESGTEPGAATPPQESMEPTVGPGGIAGLVPADPRFTDEVLLQDIYARIDLGQFALDPEEPIEFEYNKRRVSVNTDTPLESLMAHPLVHEHPFLHLFPSVQEAVDAQERPSNLRYHPAPVDRFENISANRNGLINFIYNPWFHPIYLEGNQYAAYGYSTRPREIYETFQTKGLTNFRFGDNSTKGVLLETVAKLVEEAQLPGVEPAQRAWWKEDALPHEWQQAFLTEPRDWTLEEFLSVSVNADSVIDTRKIELEGINYHITPQVEWEILHPQLPIVRVTIHSEHGLPLLPNGISRTQPELLDQIPSELHDDFVEARRNGGWTEEGFLQWINRDRQSQWENYYHLLTSYSVSFVMSFQNRWESFNDPNRWIIRFKEELGHDLPFYFMPPWKLDEDLPYPNYWDDTDYMQHRIIGPVVMTVHGVRAPFSSVWDKAALTPVLQPGTYSMTPRITEWAAPGHVLTDRQVPTERREIIKGGKYIGPPIDRPDDPGFRQWPVQPGINAGFPLPGHILVTPSYGPGSDLWREKGMDGNDW